MRSTLLSLLAVLALVAFAFADDTAITPGNWITGISVPNKDFSTMYYFDAETTDREFIIQMKKDTDSSSFDPDVYVRAGEAPTRDSHDGSDFSTGDDHTITLRPDTRTETVRYYIGVYGFSGEGNVQLRVDVYNCLNMNCGHNDDASKSAGTCATATGVCTCSTGWDALPDCSAQTITAELEESRSRTVSAGKAIFYKFVAPEVSDKAEGHLTFTIDRDPSVGMFTAMVQKGRIPTVEDNLDSSYAYTGSSQLSLSIDAAAYGSGDWYVSIEAPSKSDLEMTILAHFSACSNDCSGHGTCDAASSTCVCDEGFTVYADCSIHSPVLDPKLPQPISVAAYTTMHFSADVSEFYANAPVELGFTLTANTDNDELVFPTLYVNKDTFATDTSFMWTSPKPSGIETSVYVPMSQLSEGLYHLTVSNMESHALEYTIAMVYAPHCPVGCETNGRCTDLGECKCSEGFTGNDCSVSKAQCTALADAYQGVEIPVVLFLSFFFLVASAAVAIFVYKKFFFVAPQASPELNYDQLSA